MHIQASEVREMRQVVLDGGEKIAVLTTLRTITPAEVTRDALTTFVVANAFHQEEDWCVAIPGFDTIDACGGSPQDLLLADPGPRDMFDDRVYKRGALTLHALRRRLSDEKFFALLKDWTTRYHHSNAATDDFTGLAAGYCDESLSGLWDGWLYSKAVP